MALNRSTACLSLPFFSIHLLSIVRCTTCYIFAPKRFWPSLATSADNFRITLSWQSEINFVIETQTDLRKEIKNAIAHIAQLLSTNQVALLTTLIWFLVVVNHFHIFPDDYTILLRSDVHVNAKNLVITYNYKSCVKQFNFLTNFISQINRVLYVLEQILTFEC